MTQDAFPAIYERLTQILQKYEGRLTRERSPSLPPEKESYELRNPAHKGWEGFFASTIAHTRYVSFYLSPVYMEPGLLTGISPQLKKRMQGKSCFNFKTFDETLFQELEQLTEKSFVYYEAFYLDPEASPPPQEPQGTATDAGVRRKRQV